MQNNVMYQLTVFGGAGAAGVLIAFLYDLFRLKRRVIKTKPIVVHVEDILYWLCAAVILFLASYALSDGETRGYFYSGAVIGALLYLGLFSRPVLWLLMTLIKIISWPFREIIKLLTPIVRVIAIRFRRLAGKARNRVALEGYRFRVDFTRLKHTFTKK
ncbi:MAG: spore cortex biosynthesis protein YabQ [Clostridia bacterium]|nr:spore cortex biosynthesis protein YabQ [Clostridia bacterium]